MDFTKYNREIKTQMEVIMSIGRADTLRIRAMSEELLSIGTQRQDNTLMGFAYYYIAHSYYTDNNYPLFISNLLKGLKYQLQPECPFLLAKSYNMLGIHNCYMGNITMAMDHYLNTLHYAEQSENTYLSGVAHFNIAMIYRDLHDMTSAIDSLKKGLESFQATPETEDQQRNLAMTCSSLAECYLEIGDTETAQAYYSRHGKDINELQGDALFCALSFKIKYHDIKKDYVRRDEAIENILTAVENTISLMGVFDELFLLCDYLYKMGRLNQLWRLLNSIDRLNEQTNITMMRLKFITYRAYYYKGKGMQEEYLAACEEYFDLSGYQEEEKQDSLKNSIRLREELEKIRIEQQKMQTENMLLFDKSRRDFLTNLPNRSWMSEYTEAAFNRAFQSKTRIAFEILDIDNFKEYNDTLGHLAGDRCLQAISELLHNLIAQGFFCARHGGDEFVIVYENKSDDEIMAVSEKLRQDVMVLSLAEKNSEKLPRITISQGICNSVPTEWERTWDYFYAADQALYQSKNAGRNRIFFVPFESEGVKRL